jgi:two-component system, LytTR family, sensor kinase
MRKITFFNIMDQRKAASHLTFLGFSLLVTIIAALTGTFKGSFIETLSTFLLVFWQLEVFILFGNILFAKLNFDRSPGEITRIVIFRFTAFVAACLLAAMVLFLMLQYCIFFLAGNDPSHVLSDFVNMGFHQWFKSTITGLGGGALIFIIILWQSSLQREQKLREENLIFQNETLKNQINPHFLFNSLNTLSSLIADRPDDAEKFINKLSSIYRYILENSQKDRVPLQTELDFISDYFELHKVRDREKIVLKIDVSGNTGFNIIPVSLQILIENAVKHNMTTRENPLIISITTEGQVIIVKNNLQKTGSRLESTKIGLKNLAERVRLVTKKDLVVEETNDYFIVKVPLLK